MAGCRFGQSMGSYVSWLYVFIKALYLLNVTGQFFILNSFIGSTYRWWGIDVLNALLAGENWQDSPIFPRLTLCDVPIRRLGAGMSRVEKNVGSGFGSGFQNFLRIGYRVEKKAGFRVTRDIPGWETLQDIHFNVI
ncbi:unnamed protein product [Meloidogyne enterolobii]|uniref:Uncharacterized protein n=1 Tax=Meloidogyne enterolobii TaxID=390850 RepID=A0ACB1A9U0_MELEN